MGMRDQVATREQAQVAEQATVAGAINKMGGELQRALPKGMDGDRVARIAVTLIRRSVIEKQKKTIEYSLADCTKESFAAALLTSAALGLEPGVNGQAWLIPFQDRQAGTVECTLVIGYQGLVELAYRHPMVKVVRSGIIYGTDPVDLGEIGTAAYVSAIGRARLLNPPQGEPIGFWGSVELVSGGLLIEVLSPAQVLALRKRPPVSDKAKIKDPEHWMSRKTVLKQVLKTAPRSIEIGWAQRIDEEPGSTLFVEQIPTKIAEDTDRAAIEAGVDPETGEVTEPIKDPWDGPNFPQGES